MPGTPTGRVQIYLLGIIATHILKECALTHMRCVRLIDDTHSNIGLAVLQATLLQEFLIVIVDFEDTVELLTRNNLFSIGYEYTEIDNAVTAALDEQLLGQLGVVLQSGSHQR